MEDIRNVTSLVDTDVVIIKSTVTMGDKEIKKHEEALGEKLNKKVVILPHYFELCDYKDTHVQPKDMEEVTCELKEQPRALINIPNDMTSEQIQQWIEKFGESLEEWSENFSKALKEKVENIKKYNSDMNEIAERILANTTLKTKEEEKAQYKVLSKAEFKTIMRDLYATELKEGSIIRAIFEQEIDGRWDKISKGDKYIICELTKEKRKNYIFKSMAEFYNEDLL